MKPLRNHAMRQELHRLRAELRQARREKPIPLPGVFEPGPEGDRQRFFQAASHELRTPLSAIIGYAEFLEDGLAGDLDPEAQRYVAQIQLGARRLEGLISDLLDLVRMESGGFHLEQEETDLEATLVGEAEALRPLATAVGLELHIDTVPLSMRLDAARIARVAYHLLSNAIKFTPPGGQVSLSLRATPAGARLEVRDTGIGVAPAHHTRLFDKFYQVDSSHTRERGGVGLGLAIARALVMAHGGEIGVDSEPARGACFWVTLPGAA